MPSATITLDNAPAAAKQSSWDRRGRIMAGAIGTGLILWGGYLLTFPPPVDAGNVVSELVFLFIVGVGVFAISVAASLRDGPTRVVVTPSGVDLVWASGRTRTHAWPDLQARLALLDKRSAPDAARRIENFPSLLDLRSGLVWAAPAWRRFDLTPEAFEGVLKAASEHGLARSESQIQPRHEILSVELRGARRIVFH